MKSIKDKIEFMADCDYINNDAYEAFKRGAEECFKLTIERLNSIDAMEFNLMNVDGTRYSNQTYANWLKNKWGEE